MNEEANITIDTSQTLDVMLHQVLNQALVAVDAEAGSVMLVENKQGILQIKARLGKPRPGRKAEAVYKIGGKSIASWVVQNKRSYLCPNVDKDSHFTPARSGKYFMSLLSTPIIYEDRVIAVINADADEEDFFTGRHQARLEAVAGKVARPIAERISVLGAMAEIGIELTRSLLPKEGGVEFVLEKICRAAVRSLGADIVTLYQYVQERDEFPVEGTGPTFDGGLMDPLPMRRKVYPGDVPWTVVKERRSGFYSDVHEHEFLTREVSRPDDTPRARFIEREGIKSMAALLLPFRAAEFGNEEVVGVMFANYRTRHDFNIDEISALASFADYAAVAILNARHEEQRRAEQLRIVESISANFAHRMSNLAGTGRVATQYLREYLEEGVPPDDPRWVRQLSRIEHESEILLELAKRLTRPFRETGRIIDLAPVDLKKILEDEKRGVEAVQSHVKVRLDIPPMLPKVRSVEFQLQQVVHDLVSNAREALRDQEPAELMLRVRYNENTNRVELEIADNGPGITSEIRERLFTPGVTTKEGKLGIGLWWCRTFMQASGGNLTLRNAQPGEGTTFLLEVPCAEGEKPPYGSVQLKKREVDILVVDDEERWREQVIEALSGYSVEQADSYTAASNQLANSHFKLAIFDIRLYDADMDNIDGLRLLTDIDKGGLDTKVIMMTGFPTEQSERTARQSPRFLAYIDKGKFDLAAFKALIKQTIGRPEPSKVG